MSYEDKGWLDRALAELCRGEFAADLCRQVEEPLAFVDFLRDPVVDDETGEVVDVSRLGRRAPSFFAGLDWNGGDKGEGEASTAGLREVERQAGQPSQWGAPAIKHNHK